jgi:hypothetical protein
MKVIRQNINTIYCGRGGQVGYRGTKPAGEYTFFYRRGMKIIK